MPVIQIPLPLANLLFSSSNLALIVGSVLAVLGTAGTIWMGKIIDEDLEDRLSNVSETAEGATAKVADLNAANETLREKVETERAARLAIEQTMAPRSISAVSRRRLLAELRRYAGQAAESASVVGDAEAQQYARALQEILRAAGWTPSAQVIA